MARFWHDLKRSLEYEFGEFFPTIGIMLVLVGTMIMVIALVGDR